MLINVPDLAIQANFHLQSIHLGEQEGQFAQQRGRCFTTTSWQLKHAALLYCYVASFIPSI